MRHDAKVMKFNVRDFDRSKFGILTFQLRESGEGWANFFAGVKVEHPEFGDVLQFVGQLSLQQQSSSPELCGCYIGEWGMEDENAESFSKFIESKLCPGYELTFSCSIAKVAVKDLDVFVKLDSATERSPYMS